MIFCPHIFLENGKLYNKKAIKKELISPDLARQMPESGLKRRTFGGSDL